MNPDSQEAIEGLVTFVMTVRRDPRLLRWFDGLSRLSTVERRNEIYRMRQELVSDTSAGAQEIGRRLMLLADDRIFNAACAAVQTVQE